MATYYLNGLGESFTLEKVMKSHTRLVRTIGLCGPVEGQFWQFWSDVGKPMLYARGSFEFGEIPDGVIMFIDTHCSDTWEWDDIIKVLPKISKLGIDEIPLSHIPVTAWNHKIEVGCLILDVLIPHDIAVIVYTFGEHPPSGDPIVIDCNGEAEVQVLFGVHHPNGWDNNSDIYKLLDMFRNIKTLHIWYKHLDHIREIVPEHCFDAECVRINAISGNIKMSVFQNLPIKKLSLTHWTKYELIFDCPDEEILILSADCSSGTKNRERLCCIANQNANNMRFRRTKVGPN